MRLTMQAGVLGLLLLAGAARAAQFNPEVDFVTRASRLDALAGAETRLALARGRQPKVKAFAQKLAAGDHDAASLQAAAAGSGAKLATALDADGQKRLAALQARSGDAFDKAYVADQLAIHSDALTLYADYMLLGDNEKLKALAIRMIPLVEAQLKQTQTLDGD
jgi:putative membrane protein